MVLNAITEHEWRKLMSAEIEASAIRDRCERVVDTLAAVCAPRKMPNGLGLSFENDADGLSLGIINTPFYEGRFRLDWMIRDALLGRLVVERKISDERDQTFWQPVMEISVPSYDNPYVGDGAERVSILLDRELGSHRENSVFSLGMSILVAIAKGPQE